jgi:hypothetical protein
MAHAGSPPRAALQAAWIGGSLIIYPGDITGTMFFVDSVHGDTNNSGLSWDNAMATIDEAVNKCTAAHGDWIMVAPSHVENLAADSAVDIDVEGVTVYGVRQGNYMPTLTATGTTGDLKLAAANVTVKNIRFSGGIDVTTGIVEIGAFANCALIDCEYIDTTGQCTDAVMILNGSSNILIDGHIHRGDAAAGTNSAIAAAGCTDLEIRNCKLYGNFAVGAIDIRTNACTRVNIHDCKIWTENAADIAVIDTITTSTGWIGPNLSIALQDNAANITTACTGATFQYVDPIYIVNLVGEKAMLTNLTASTHA